MSADPAAAPAGHEVVHAFVSVSLLDDTSPLIISGWDEERGEARDLLSVHLPEFYALYGSMADHRF